MATATAGIWTKDDLPALKAAYKALVLGRSVATVRDSDTTIEYRNTPAQRRELLSIINDLEGRARPTTHVRVRTSKGL